VVERRCHAEHDITEKRYPEVEKGLSRAIKTQIRDNYQKGAYRPYNLKASVLKSKDTNSILLACILPNVKDKRLVEYRMKSQSVEKDRLRTVRGRVTGYIEEGLERITKDMNQSASL
jgi:hypothetical protein